ncbi:hypothetical protein NQZ68_007590 [Dissostichus eleginoides]|nr:hypothetical protein NQZ68_007590 [Dissostichus eleginoides]
MIERETIPGNVSPNSTELLITEGLPQGDLCVRGRAWCPAIDTSASQSDTSSCSALANDSVQWACLSTGIDSALHFLSISISIASGCPDGTGCGAREPPVRLQVEQRETMGVAERVLLQSQVLLPLLLAPGRHLRGEAAAVRGGEEEEEEEDLKTWTRFFPAAQPGPEHIFRLDFCGLSPVFPLEV